jgi:exopolysaccharide production protein ExoQ
MFKYPALIAALLLCFWLLKRVVRRSPSVSAAIWIPTVYVMVMGSRPLSSWLQGGQKAKSASLLDQLFSLVAIGAPLIIASMRGVKWGRFLGANLSLLLLYAYFAASIFWSDDPPGSAIRLARDFGSLFVIGLIYSEADPMQAIRNVFIRSACVLFPLSIVFNQYFPTFGRDFGMGSVLMHTGVTLQKNSLGEIVFVFCLFILWDYIETPQIGPRRNFLRAMSWDYILLFLMGIVLLVQCQSKTSLVCLVLGGALSLRKGALASRTASTVAFISILATPFLLFFTNEFGDIIEPIINALGRDMTFTGRTNIWDHITATSVNPMIGCGYFVFWQGPRGLAISEAINWPIPTAHCGYLDCYLDGGIIALALLLFMLVSCGWRLIRRNPEGRFRIVGLAVLCASIIYNLSESSFVRAEPLWFATVLMMVEFPQRRRIAKGAQQMRSREDSLSELQVPEGAECLPAR